MVKKIIEVNFKNTFLIIIFLYWITFAYNSVFGEFFEWLIVLNVYYSINLIKQRTIEFKFFSIMPIKKKEIFKADLIFLSVIYLIFISIYYFGRSLCGSEIGILKMMIIAIALGVYIFNFLIEKYLEKDYIEKVLLGAGVCSCVETIFEFVWGMDIPINVSVVGISTFIILGIWNIKKYHSELKMELEE